MRRETPINDYYKFKDKLKSSVNHSHESKERQEFLNKLFKREYRKS